MLGTCTDHICNLCPMRRREIDEDSDHRHIQVQLDFLQAWLEDIKDGQIPKCFSQHPPKKFCYAATLKLIKENEKFSRAYSYLKSKINNRDEPLVFSFEETYAFHASLFDAQGRLDVKSVHAVMLMQFPELADELPEIEI